MQAAASKDIPSGTRMSIRDDVTTRLE